MNNLIFGTWQLSDDENKREGFTTEYKIKLLKSAYSAGINTYDTAPVYGNVELLLGMTIPQANFITKIPAFKKPPSDLTSSLDWIDFYNHDHLKSSIEKSLNKLGSIQTILLHNWHPSFNESILEKLRLIADEFNIPEIGVSLPNYSISTLGFDLNSVDRVMVNYKYINSLSNIDSETSTILDQKLLIRSIYAHGINFNTNIGQKLSNSNIVVGMTNLFQVYSNIVNLDAKTHYFEEPENIINIGPTTNKPYSMLKLTYGNIANSEEDPLVNVSHAHSSLSIDIWKGCAFKCAYCHVQGTDQDLVDGRMPSKPIRRTNHTIKEIVDRLVTSPFYNPNIPISIGTSSTEPLSRDVVDSTIRIMEYFVALGLNNPFWIVTKNGYRLNDYDHNRIATIINSNKILISFCFANNPKEIEPATHDRFKGIERFRSIGGITAWYMRPLTIEWGGNPTDLEPVIANISQRYGKYLDMIVPGGLRWTDGIEYGMTEIYKQPMPNLSKSDNQKTLDDKSWDQMLEIISRHFPEKPVFKKSSCMISYAFNKPSITLVNLLNTPNCKCSVCPNPQRELCNSKTISTNDISDALSKFRLTKELEEQFDLSELKNLEYLKAQGIIHELGSK